MWSWNLSPSLLPKQAPEIIAPAMFRCLSESEPPAFLTTVHNSQPLHPSPYCGAVPWSKRGQSWHSNQAGAHTRAVGGNQPRSWAVSISFLPLILGVCKCVHILHAWCLSFLQPCSQFHWFSNQQRRVVLSVFNWGSSQGWGTQ